MNYNTDTNLMIMVCTKGTPARNAPLLCAQVDYSFLYGHLPYPYEMFEHLIRCNNASIVRE